MSKPSGPTWSGAAGPVSEWYSQQVELVFQQPSPAVTVFGASGFLNRTYHLLLNLQLVVVSAEAHINALLSLFHQNPPGAL